ncbi:MAG: hypothetical protein AB7K04_03025 [Pseudorhodoplanes sp.]
MSKILTLAAAVVGLFALSFAGPADAAQRKADGISKQQSSNYEISDQRRYHRRHYRPYRHYYRPYYRHRYWGGYPYYGYGYPYGYYRPYYGYGPGFSFGFRF